MLEARNPRPAALTRQLDSLFQLFRDPFIRYAAQAYRVQSLERTLGQIKLRLDSVRARARSTIRSIGPSPSPSDSLTQAHRRRDDTQRALGIVRLDIAPSIDSLRQQMAKWKDSTYRGYDSITKELGSGIGREPIADSTGRDGSATIRLPRGQWWIYARSWDAVGSEQRVVLEHTGVRRAGCA